MRTKLLVVTIFALLCSSGSALRAQQGSADPSLWIEVRDEQGLPLKNACITVVPKEGEIVFRKADGRGRVRVRNMVRGHYRVTAKVDGYTAQKKEVEMGATVETVSFTLQLRNQ
jgi:hypothetical protein